jgi:2-polyprenyl-3-methyl-5-hydroxy-6-metoxy-1,4-benzoquinol methylase
MPRDPISRLILDVFVRSIRRVVNNLPARSILDVGCGNGWLTSHLITAQPSAMIYALDVSEALLEPSAGLPSSAKRVIAAAEFLPFRADTFDLVVATEMLEHVPRPELVLHEIRRVTAGHTLLTVPYEPFWSLGNILFGRHLRNLGNTPGHLHRWGRRRFLTLVDAYFVRVSSRIAFPWIVVLARKRKGTDR